MPLIDHQQAPSQSMRRWFGASLAALLWILAYAFSHYGNLVTGLLVGSGLIVGVVYYAVPRSQLSIIRVWQVVTYPLAFVISHLLLGIVFFGVVVPIGCVLRWRRYDPLRLRGDIRDTEWVKRESKPDVTRYFKQF